MKTLAMTLTAAMLALGTMAMTANAQTLPGATCLRGEVVTIAGYQARELSGMDGSLWLRPGPSQFVPWRLLPLRPCY